MLHNNLIVKGPLSKEITPNDWSVVEYSIDCLKKREPKEVFCIDGVTDESTTCGQIVSNSLKTAYILRNHGVQKGDVVAIISENSTKYFAPFFATIYIGAAVNLLNPIYTTGELQRALDKTNPKVIFCSKTAYKNVKEIATKLESLTALILLEKNADAPNVNVLDLLIENTTVDEKSVKPAHVNTKECIAMILLSSGTTGLPKCVMITHKNCESSKIYFNHPMYLEVTNDDTTVAIPPFFHILGVSSIFIAAVSSMKLIVIPAFQPEMYLQCIQKYTATLLYAVPPIIAFLAKHPLVKKFDLTSVKKILCSGGFLGYEIQEEFMKIHPDICIYQFYGLTETCGAVTFCPGGNLEKIGSVGYVIPNTEAMVWNNELNENVGASQTGELCFRGPSIMKGYIEHDENCIDKFGFYHTGDLGFYDKDGFFYIVGRIKELIKYKGFQVSPAELEDLLMKHPAIKECGVIGIPDARAGEIPAALVVRQNNAAVTEKDVVDFVAERISTHKHLYGGVKFVDFIPRNATGKVLRDKLHALY